MISVKQIALTVSIALAACFMSSDILAQNKALIIIDIQDFYFPGGAMPLHEPGKAALNAAILLDNFRSDGELVIHVRHNFEPGGSIFKDVSPLPGEAVISKDHVNAFRETKLESILQENEIVELVICGMQTHMCVEAATRAASDLGFECILIEDACATRALQYGETIISAEAVHESTLATLKSYARIQTTSEYLRTTLSAE